MRRVLSSRCMIAVTSMVLGASSMAMAQMSPSTMPSTKDRPLHDESERHAADRPVAAEADELPPPQLPEGKTLDDVLDEAMRRPMSEMDGIMSDDALRAFFKFEQLEYRMADTGRDHFGWHGDGWVGYELDKFVIKTEGEVTFDGADEGESETDVLYSRLLTPFWQGQVGLQYANGWSPGDYDDRFSGVVAVAGTLPWMIETDFSLYLSDQAHVTAELELEYDIRITQKLVLQPRAELAFAFQDVDDRNLGAGLTTADLDLRLRYEITRKLAPYIGVRYHILAGETRGLTRSAGGDVQQVMFLTGVQLAF